MRFWGGHALFPGRRRHGRRALPVRPRRERRHGLNTRDRDLITFGTRWNKPRKAGDLYWELESSRPVSRAAPGLHAGLDHEAFFHHVALGYAFEGENKSRIEALFDYASGDNDPNDGENNRFDTLFGARRFEFGPTGIFGAFARANLVSPGLRFVTKPAKDWELMVTHRFHYLASDRDAWTTSGLRDVTGNSGSNIGSLSEFRVRHDIAPKSLRLEFGMAYLAAGSFIDDARTRRPGRQPLRARPDELHVLIRVRPRRLRLRRDDPSPPADPGRAVASRRPPPPGHPPRAPRSSLARRSRPRLRPGFGERLIQTRFESMSNRLRRGERGARACSTGCSRSSTSAAGSWRSTPS